MLITFRITRNTMARATYIVVLISCLLGVKSLPHEGSSLRVVGGHAANITEVPYMARYCSPAHDRCCGAAIISERFLISTADCYYNMFERARYTIAIVGTDQLYGDGEAYVIEEAYPHPSFIPLPPTPESNSMSFKPSIGHLTFPWEYNVVLLKLTKELKFSDKVGSIPLADEHLELPEGAMLDTMGFGSTSPALFDPKIPSQLQKVSVPFISEEKCRAKYHPSLQENMICAGSTWKGSGMFDEGGPLVFDNQLVGVLSLPESFASVYTPISGVRDFIDAMLQNEKKA